MSSATSNKSLLLNYFDPTDTGKRQMLSLEEGACHHVAGWRSGGGCILNVGPELCKLRTEIMGTFKGVNLKITHM